MHQSSLIIALNVPQIDNLCTNVLRELNDQHVLISYSLPFFL